jgi:ADP-heptose:LPS heptosyltransferase
MLDARRPVAVFANAIGDHLLTLPAVRALANLFGGRLSLVCTHGASQIFYSDLPLRAVHEVEMRRVPTSSRRTREEMFTRVFDGEAVARGVGDCDLLLSLNTWHSRSVETLLERLSPAASVGFYSAFQVQLPLDFDKHSSDLAFDIPLYLDPSLRAEEFAAPPAFSEDVRRRVRALRAALPASVKILAVHAETGPEKLWPIPRFVSLLDTFLERHPDFVVAAVGLRDIGLGGGRHGERVFPCYGFPLSVGMALTGQSDLFLGVDSCMLHAADLFSVPGVGLFGPTSSRNWGFRFGPHRHVCGEMTTETIREEEVLVALEALLAEHGAT